MTLNQITDKIELARVLTHMPFGVMMEVAEAMVEMNMEVEYDRDVKTPLGMAKTLTDWAMAEIET